MNYAFICEKGDEVSESQIQPQGRIQEAKDQADPFKGMDQDKSVLLPVPIYHIHDGKHCSVTPKAVVR